MDLIKTLKKESLKKSIGWAVWPTVFGLLFTLITPVAGVILFALAVFLIAYAASGQYQKQLKAKAEELSPENPGQVLKQAARLREDVPSVKGLRVGYDLVYIERGARQWLFSAQEVCWAYQGTTRHTVFYIIPIWKSYSLMLRTADGKMLEIPMRRAKVQETLEMLKTALPACVIGYSKELANLYGQDREGFLQAAAGRREAEV